ncbi:MAG: zinc-binding dehydrogenase [Actinobacteria bacterium]|nr:zinc-binding dehydrogenase [Actinomycetota bacterium]
MKAITLRRYGGLDALTLEEVPDPTPTEGEALVAIEAAAVNHLDLDLRDGSSRLPLELPHILGLEGAGRVRSLPDDYDGPLGVGDRVLIIEDLPCGTCARCRAGRGNLCEQGEWTGVGRQGTYAELIAVPCAGLLPLPEQRSAAEWATVQGTFGTAWHMLVSRGNVRPDEWVLVNAVGSGIGSAALQVASLAGAKVIATAGSAAKLERARELGASATVDYSRESIGEMVTEVTAGAGVDLVFEHVGGQVFVDSLAAIRVGGRMVTCGAHGGEQVDLDVIELFRAERQIIGSMSTTVDEVRHVVAMVGAGRLDPVIDRELPLAEAAEAHRILADRQAYGKVVLVVDAPSKT